MTAAVDPMIRVDRASVRAKRVPLLDEISMGIAPGEWVSVIGPNGAGKSTLLRALAGVMSSDGEITVAGEPVGGLTPRQRSRQVAWVPQSPTIPPGIPVFDYVLLGRTPHLGPLERERREDLAIAEAVLDELDLAHLGSRMIDTLSGGELQRAVIARALAQQTPVLLLDEPTSALDLGHQQELLELLDRLRASGDRTIVTTMHDLTLAGLFADRLVLLACGRMVAEGTAADVLTEDTLERIYGAKVRVTNENGRVIVTPRIDRASA